MYIKEVTGIDALDKSLKEKVFKMYGGGGLQGGGGGVKCFC